MIFIVVLFAVSVISYGVGKFELWLKWQDGYHKGYVKAMKEIDEALDNLEGTRENRIHS